MVTFVILAIVLAVAMAGAAVGVDSRRGFTGAPRLDI